MTSVLLVLGLVLLVAAGCQSAAAVPTPGPTFRPPPTAAATVPPAVPTATVILAAPTAPPTSLPPVPTADFAPADIVGTWARSDPDRGYLFLTCTEQGTYRAAHGTPAGIVHAGTYSLNGRLLTFEEGWTCAPLPDDTPGQYMLRLAGKGRWLYLDLYDDSCPDRPSALRKVRWTRYEPAAAP